MRRRAPRRRRRSVPWSAVCLRGMTDADAYTRRGSPFQRDPRIPMRLLVSLTLAPFVVAAALAADAPIGVQYRKAAEVDAVRASGDTGGLIITDPEFKVLA